MEDFSVRQAHHMHHPSNPKVDQIWLWHHQLGHLSFGYLKYVFPELFSYLLSSDFKYETCILAKSY